MYTLNTDVKAIHGIGTALQQRLAQRQILTVRDLLLQLPLRYEDRRQILSIADVFQHGAEIQTPITVIAQVKNTSQQWRGRKSIQRATLTDQSGQIKITWFNCPFIIQTLKSDGQFYFSGIWNEKYQTLQQPVVERVTTQTAIHTARLVPLYSSVTGVSSGWMRRIFTTLFDQLEITDPLIHQAQTAVPLLEALRQLHFPEEPENVIAARLRIALEELLSLMQQADQQKKQWSKVKAIKILDHVLDPKQLQSQVKQLPFQLTNGQQQSLQDILADLSKSKPMNRLLQGDVGSGKTVIALLASQLCITQGNSVCLLAPTRILAQQHLSTTQTLFPNLPCELILGGTKVKKINEALTAKLYIGTHALVSRITEIQPSLIIYDEQQRFGVVQRSNQAEFKLKPKKTAPHVLTMTATPIPRSLMLTVFSHLSLSVIGEMPKERKPTITWYIPESKRQGAYGWLAESIKQSETLAMIVCPFIDPSETESLENVAAAKDMYEKIVAQLPKDTKVALLHGKQGKDEQKTVIEAAFAGKIDVIISTPIVEVGVDLPQATIMIIEAAERFGLSSLHQLRGRVGRRGQQGYCLVFSSSSDAKAKERLKIFAKTLDGQKIAELDLANRGAGNLFGIEQHGFDQLRFASWADTQLIATAQKLYSTLPKNWQSGLFPAELETSVAAN